MKNLLWRKPNKRMVLWAAILFILLCSLTGCYPNNFTIEEKNAFLRQAREVMADYFSDRYSRAKIREIEPETVLVEDGYELTEFASGQFVWRKQTYDFVVNTETGEVYTSVQIGEIRERLKEEIVREMGFHDEDTALADCDISYLTDRGEFRNVLPEGTVEGLVEEILQDTDRYRFDMSFQYRGEDLSAEMMEWESPFPTLTGVGIYHVADEHAFYEGEYGYSTLPSLSREILVLIFYKDAPEYEYTRYETLEQDGLRLVYKAYERIGEQGAVTESVINREDITLTVTDEYIRVDCAKDDYSIYLSTRDRKIAGRYRYVNLSNSVNTDQEAETGMWYPYEDGYVFADNVYIAVPYEIRPYYREGNVIWSSPQKK